MQRGACGNGVQRKGNGRGQVTFACSNSRWVNVPSISRNCDYLLSVPLFPQLNYEEDFTFESE